MTEQPPEQGLPEKSGGNGGELLDAKRHFRMDCRLIERYGIDEAVRKGMVGRLVQIMADKTVGSRSHVAAVRALALLDRINLDLTKTAAGIPATQINIVNQNAVSIRGEVEAMDATIPLPSESDPCKPHPNGNDKQNGNGKATP